MADEIRRLRNEVRANYVVLETGLNDLRQEFHTHAGETRSGMDELRSGLDEVRSGLDEVRSALDSTQASVARLARQQDAHAERVNEKFTESIDASVALNASVDAVFDVIEKRYDEIDDIQRRLSELEEWRKRQAG